MPKAASDASEGDDKPKRPKTGGRTKKTVDQMLLETKVRSELAGYHEDTPVPAALAAIFLGISEDKLLELRKPRPKGPGGERGAEGPPFYKSTLPGAVGQNQAVMYPLGGLKEYFKKHMGVTSHEVALKSNMLGWVAAQEPFFAQLEARRQPTTLICRAWDFDDADRDDLFARAARGEIRVVWMPSAEAVRCRWQSSARHKALMDVWIELLKAEEGAARAALERTELHESAKEARQDQATQPTVKLRHRPRVL